MKISIPRKVLVDHAACASGLAWFDHFKDEMGVPKNKVLRIDWTVDLMIKLLCGEGQRYVRWAMDRNIVPLLNLVGAYFAGLNLEGVNLDSTNIRGANFRGANLSRAIFKDANLRGASFRKAVLCGANFYGANLRDVKFEGANLRHATLERAIVEGATFEGAVIEGASFEGAYYPLGGIPEGWRRTPMGYLTKA